ncbi:MAG TPA: DNA polymerase III subunit delta [Candidatus Saccharimonadales bacterium]|jgi:DNA polymerase-3 subunit delta|nr:DNA polymerase III subunit delta [Candidatus Saccharimonadales bacterium]
MITILSGENSFEVQRALRVIIHGFGGAVEKVDGSELELKQLPDLLMGGTLFADKRLIVIKQLSDNKAIWPIFSDWLPRVSDDIHLVLVESKLDKRTKTYKDLQKIATVTEYPAWTERDTSKAEQWVAGEARAHDMDIDSASVRLLVQRVGADQWLLYQALQKLSVLDVITQERIIDIIEANPIENVFDLFESALRGNSAKVKQMIATLELSEDPYRLFGLLSGQAFQLAALAVAGDKPSAQVAKDLGVHPYGLSKLSSHAHHLGRLGVKRVIGAFAEADAGMKSSAIDPWLLIERALIKTATQ